MPFTATLATLGKIFELYVGGRGTGIYGTRYRITCAMSCSAAAMRSSNRDIVKSGVRM
jgi:hypothetical protein